MNLADFAPIYPELVLLVFSLLVLMLDLRIKRDKDKSLLGLICAFGLIIALYLVLMGIYGFDHSGQTQDVFNGLIKYNLFALFFKLIFLIAAILVVIGSMDYVRLDKNQGEYYGLLMFATLGMMSIAQAGDIILLYVGMELASISTYALAAFRKDRMNSEAAMKYFIVGAFSSGIIIFGISLIYGLAGTTNIYEMGGMLDTTLATHGPIGLLAAVLLIAGFGYKMSLVPFHMWAPDTYQGVPTTVSAFLSAGSKKMGFAAAFIIFLVVLNNSIISSQWQIMLGVLAGATMTYGNVVATVQKDIKRMLAYSSVGQAGYILVGLLVASAALDLSMQSLMAGQIPMGEFFNTIAVLGLGAALFHILTHTVMKAGAFLAVASASSIGIGDNIEDYKGLRYKAPITALAMSVFLLSLAGIPLFGGFVSKFLLLYAAIAGGLSPGFMWLLALGGLLVVNSVISLFYYGRVIIFMYFSPDEGGWAGMAEPGFLKIALIVAAVMTIWMGILPDIFVTLSMDAAKSLIIEIISFSPF